MAFGAEEVRGLQERAARALPAEHVVKVGGWWLRHAPRCSWWVGTVLPHGDAGRSELERRVAAAERFYADRGAVARFQLMPGACSPSLDDLLAGRGYRREGLIAVRAVETAEVLRRLPDGPLRTDVAEGLSRDWFDTWHTVNGHGGDLGAEWELLGRVAGASGYARALIDGEVGAVGRMVVDDGWAGVFGMATLPSARGKGAARSVLAALAHWAAGNGADRMYLQVESGNRPAVRLYERAGFAEVGVYHYRTAASVS